MKAYERLLKYVVVRTPSDENSETVPSSKCQFDLANILVDELKELGELPEDGIHRSHGHGFRFLRP